MTLQSTPGMRRAFADAAKSGRITSQTVEWAARQGFSEEFLDDVIDRVQTRNRSLARAGAPHLNRPAEEDRPEHGPTQQCESKYGRRLAKKKIGRHEFYQFRSIMDQYGSKFSDVQRAALERFLDDATLALKIRTANFEPSGRRISTDAMGGVGADHDERVAYVRHAWVVRFLSAGAKLTAKALVTHELVRGDGAPLTLEDFGAKIFPDVQHLHRLWGVAMGALWQLAGQLAHLYALAPAASVPLRRQTGVLV